MVYLRRPRVDGWSTAHLLRSDNEYKTIKTHNRNIESGDEEI